MSTALAALPFAKIFAIGGTAVNIAGTLISGISANRAAQEEAEDLRFQAQIKKEESDIEAERLKTKHKKFLARQSLMFVKSGVTLAGSPLRVLEETRTEAEKEVSAVRRVGQAQFDLGQRKAARVSKAGRSAFIGSLFGAASTGFKGFREFQKI